jgi:hypothetical protein
MARSNIGGMVLGALALGSRLSTFELVVLAGLLVVWMAPYWLRKPIVLAKQLIELIESCGAFGPVGRLRHAAVLIDLEAAKTEADAERVQQDVAAQTKRRNRAPDAESEANE